MAENENIDELGFDDSSLEKVIESKNKIKAAIDDIIIQDEKNLNIKNKQKKTKKILLSLIGILSLSIIIILVLYSSGFFDIKQATKPNKKQNYTNNIVLDKNKDYFYKTDIDINKLNNKLKLLTKEELRFDNDEDLKKDKKIYEDKKKFDAFKKQARVEARLEEEQRRLQEEKNKLEIQKQTLEKKRDELKKLQEEIENKNIQKQEEIENKNKTNPNSDIKDVKNKQLDLKKIKKTLKKEENNDLQNFVKLINVVSIEGNLYESYLKKIEKINRDLLLCRDHLNRIDIYFGPYLDEKEREKIIQELFKNGFVESYGIDLTKEEYKNRCKY